MAMLEDTLPIATPTRLLLEAMPDFESLSEINPFEYSFKSISGLPSTPGTSSFSAFKTPDPLYGYKCFPSPSHYPSTSPPQPSLVNKREEPIPSSQSPSSLPDPPPPSPQGDPQKGHFHSPSSGDVMEKNLRACPQNQNGPLAKNQPHNYPAIDSISADGRTSSRRVSVTDWIEYDRSRRGGSVDSDASSSSSLSTKRKASISDELEDPEVKRRRFLERNRMAASKCRQKKKIWMQELEQRADVVQHRNKALNNLISQLKEETLILKNQLLSHQNCNCNLIRQYIQTSGHFSSLINSMEAQSMRTLHHHSLLPPPPSSLPPQFPPRHHDPAPQYHLSLPHHPPPIHPLSHPLVAPREITFVQ